jgi:L-alanine-DL-glutamate epimerase-like enolase superfamily enzyme
MKITKFQTQLLRTPADEALTGGPVTPGATRDFVTLKLQTDAGIEGIGYTFFGAALTGALKAAVDAFAGLAIGEDPLRPEAVAAKLRAAALGSGPGGIQTLALSAIDIALEHLLNAAPRLVEKGFRQMKTQLALPGETSPASEVDRIRKVRESIGPDVDLMCDINQRWRVEQAIDIGSRIEDVRLYWLEDVTTADDYQGLARVTDALVTPVCGGEYLYGLAPFRQMLEARSVDIVMIDLMRAGGITQWLKIAGMAEAFNLPVVSHLVPEIHVHLIAAVPNGLTVEYMPWTFKIFEEVPVPVKGELVVPRKPGLGLKFDEAALKRYAA